MRKIILILISLLVASVTISNNKKIDIFKTFEIILNDEGNKPLAFSSSHLIEKRKPENYYGAQKAVDGNKNTAWVAGGENGGIDEYIIMEIYTGNKKIKYPYKTFIKVINGFARNKRLFLQNNRVKKAILEIYEVEINYGVDKITIAQQPILNSKVILNLNDTMKGQKFYFNIKNKLKGDEFPDFKYFGKLIIKEIYKGKKYNDTCISEIYI